MARLINAQLIYVEAKTGDGKKDPIRAVHQWWAPDGTLALQYDTYKDQTTMTINMVDYLKSLSL